MGLEAKIFGDLKQLKAGCEEVKGWLTKLEDKKCSVKSEVYQKVKNDYLSRLSELEKKASDMLPKLEAELSILRKKLADVRSHKDELSTNLEELALRRDLGELSCDDFDTRSKTISEQIENYKNDELSLGSSVDEFNSILEGFIEAHACAAAEPIEEEKVEEVITVEQKPAEVIEAKEEPSTSETAKAEVVEEVSEIKTITIEEAIKPANEERVAKVVEEIIEKETEGAQGEEPVELSTIGEILEEIEEEKAKADTKGIKDVPKIKVSEEVVDLKSLATEIGTPKAVPTPPQSPAECAAPSVAASLAKVPGPKVVYSDGKNEYAVSIDAKVSVIGSSEDADVILRFPGISPKHAEITKKGNRFILRDLGSGAGTFIGGQKIKGKVELNHLDVVKLGSLELRVFLED